MKRKPISQTEAENEFICVRRTFFPQWDRKCLWKVKMEADLDGFLGECCRRSKTIRLLDDVAPYSLRSVLIHEIAHAAVTTGILFDAHGFDWQKRMEGATRRAERLGTSGLATEIRQDVERWNNPGARERFCSELWYGEIRKAVRLQPEASFTEIFHTLPLSSVYSEQEFLVEYKEARNVYDERRSAAILGLTSVGQKGCR